ncbi:MULTISPECIES: ubiquitin-like small modifier protein 1 [unclassified Methanoregula]|uniref:ubiquitin-like small modifier protein 1 n=1 Tax=unclassified Methanoregula TaxID=2649730 RepID=UPI0009C987CD|nr:MULTISPECIES: ubiquitin-like small modifier protein 1 [unclassified Methanoregula]OPX62643.1 MAG: molybdopterin synthase small subunit [Methanoregula sp. PtaB.Bin085]OPY33018.1 MAG: molybdopterin synthase small subunit [Methanoregula sp. PtaU1.Bin006]
MTAKLRFFAKFRELLGTDIPVPVPEGSTILSLVRDTAWKNKEGYDAIFDDKGNFHEFVIVMRNGKRVEHGDAAAARVADGDEIAVFPPVAGG